MAQSQVGCWTPHGTDDSISEMAHGTSAQIVKSRLNKACSEDLEVNRKVAEWTEAVVLATEEFKMNAISAQRKYQLSRSSQESDESEDSGYAELTAENLALKEQIKQMREEADRKRSESFLRRPERQDPRRQVPDEAHTSGRMAGEREEAFQAPEWLPRMTTKRLPAMTPGVDMRFWGELDDVYGRGNSWMRKQGRQLRIKYLRRTEIRRFFDPDTGKMKLTNESTILAYVRRAYWKTEPIFKWYWEPEYEEYVWLSQEQAQDLGFEDKEVDSPSPSRTGPQREPSFREYRPRRWQGMKAWGRKPKGRPWCTEWPEDEGQGGRSATSRDTRGETGIRGRQNPGAREQRGWADRQRSEAPRAAIRRSEKSPQPQVGQKGPRQRRSLEFRREPTPSPVREETGSVASSPRRDTRKVQRDDSDEETEPRSQRTKFTSEKTSD